MCIAFLDVFCENQEDAQRSCSYPHGPHPHAVAVDHDVGVHKAVPGARAVSCAAASPPSANR